MIRSDPIQPSCAVVLYVWRGFGSKRPHMRHLLSFIVALCALISSLPVAAQNAPAEKRIALVIGNAGYQTGALHTPANDAGLIAQTLQAAGFDVAGARDLDQDSLRRELRA